MDTLCGLGIPELIILVLLAFVLIGPERGQEVAVKVGRFLRNVMRSQWWGEINEITRAMRNLPTTLVRMAELEDAQAELQRTMHEIDQSARITKTPVDPPGAPPDPEQATSDPWGIQNAVAATRYPTPPAPAQPDGEELPADNDTIEGSDA